MDFNRAATLDDETEAAIDDCFRYHPWDDDQGVKGNLVRAALAEAVRVIITQVPPSPDRTVAIRKLREARMDCSSAISHAGKY